MSILSSLARGLALIATIVAAGCSAPPPSAAPTAELPFVQAVNVATDHLFSQHQGQSLSLFGQTVQLPGVIAKLQKRALVIDPLIDGASGQQTQATRAAEQLIAERVKGGYPHFEVLPFQREGVTKASLALTGTLTPAREADTSVRGRYALSLALADLKTGQIVAQTSAAIRDPQLDMTPMPYFRDSPVLVRDAVVDGYVRTAYTPVGRPADKAYIDRLQSAALISDALAAYNAERYQEALGLFKAAQASPGGEQLRVYNGLYLTNWKLGKASDAEQAFGQVVALGLANNSLGVKFLFNAGTTDFWSDANVSGAYGLWLRQIAQQAKTSKVCMNIVGHTSRTGSESVNERLSNQRAAYIRQRLEAEAPDLGGRLRASGVGWRENLVGSGTDDARDALDRRVEFRIVGC